MQKKGLRVTILNYRTVLKPTRGGGGGGGGGGEERDFPCKESQTVQKGGPGSLRSCFPSCHLHVDMKIVRRPADRDITRNVVVTWTDR